MRCLLIALFCVAHAGVSDALETSKFAFPAMPADVIPPSVLALDGAGFGANATADAPGMHDYDGNAGDERVDDGGEVFEALGGGYWLAGSHFHAADGTTEAFIARIADDGSYDTSSGTGQTFFPVPFRHLGGITDVAKDPSPGSDRFYFTGPVTRSGGSDDDFAVFCAHSDGAPCNGFGVGGLVSKNITTGNDNPRQIRIDSSGHIIVTGTCDNGQGGPSDLDMCFIEMDATSGQPVASFGSNGLVVLPGFDAAPNGTDFPYDILVTPASAPGGTRIYVAVFSQASATTGVGRILALNAANGQLDPSFGSGGVVNIASAGYGLTAATAITQLANGDLAIVGGASADAVHLVMLLVEVDTNGAFVSSFCGHGVCFPPSPPDLNVPYAIAERHGSHDLVVPINLANTAGANGQRLQAVVQYSANGSALRGTQILDYRAASGKIHDSYVSGFLLDTQDRVLVSGTRFWNNAFAAGSADYDMTLARMIDTDTIFVNGFEP